MKGILYRPIKPEDYEAVGEILNQAFGLFRYVSDEKTLDCFKLQYVYSCLAEATYTQVAEQEGKVIGVIMGHSENARRCRKHLLWGWNTIYYSLRMMYLCRKSKSEIAGYKDLHKIYNEFFRKHKGEFDGVLTLFAVDESCRGQGVGKTLLSGLLEFLKEKNTKKIYLYSDSTCNYGFYEHEGFQCLEKQTLSLLREQKLFQMNVFLYEYSL